MSAAVQFLILTVYRTIISLRRRWHVISKILRNMQLGHSWVLFFSRETWCCHGSGDENLFLMECGIVLSCWNEDRFQTNLLRDRCRWVRILQI